MRIYDKKYVVNPENFPEYCSDELHDNLSFLKEIGLVDTTSNSSNGECEIPHFLTSEGLRITEKLMDRYYSQLS
jgi:hypothetical protein